MVRKNTLKTNIIKTFSLIAAFICIASTFVVGSSVYATDPDCTTSNGVETCTYADGTICETTVSTGFKKCTKGNTVTCNGSPCDNDSNFQVNVTEILSVAITPSVSAVQTGTSRFLRNTVGLAVISNNAAGFTASMTTKTATTALTDTSGTYTIPTLDNNTTTTRSALSSRTGSDTSAWAYSLKDFTKADSSTTYTNESDAGTAGATYGPLVGVNDTPIIVLHASAPSESTQDVYFGAINTGINGSGAIADGTYSNTVIFSVVGGVITNSNDNPNDNPITPVTPARPSDTVAVNPSYNSTYDRTTYTSTTTNGSGDSQTTTTTTTVTKGDTRTSYASPQGVVSSFLGFCEESPLAAGLVIAAVVSALGGLVFFVVAKRKKDKEDDSSNDY